MDAQSALAVAGAQADAVARQRAARDRWRVAGRLALTAPLVVVALLLSVTFHEYGHCLELWALSDQTECHTVYYSPFGAQAQGLLGGVYDVPVYRGNGLVHGVIHALSKGGALLVAWLSVRWSVRVPSKVAAKPADVAGGA